MLRPIKFRHSSENFKNPEKGVQYEITLDIYHDYVLALIEECNPNDIAQWDLIVDYDGRSWYTLLREVLADVLDVDSRVPMGYLIEDYIEQCPYNLHDNDPDPQTALPDEWRFG